MTVKTPAKIAGLALALAAFVNIAPVAAAQDDLACSRKWCVQSSQTVAAGSFSIKGTRPR